MRLLAFLGLLLCIFHASASVPADACKKYKQENPVYSQSRCRCNNFPKVLQTPPSQFQRLKMAAACDYEIRDSEARVVGDFFFQGEQIISGVIRREPSEFLDEFTLRGEKITPWPEKPPVFFRHEVYLQFNDKLMAEKAFKTPKPNKRTPCWEARVKLKIITIQSVFGWDNREGDFPRKYNVLTVGPYRKCLNPSPDPFAQ
jgi:hypothetical protein